MTWSAYWLDPTHVLSLDQTHGINVLRVNVSHAAAAVRAPAIVHSPATSAIPAHYACVLRKEDVFPGGTS
jgi:hypothetical protein